MTDPIAAALTLVRSLWPQTSSWPPTVWQAWAHALGDLDPDALLNGVRRAASSEAWPSIASIRKGAVAEQLAPAAAVALQHKEHPLVREVVRECTSWSGYGDMMDFDSEAFGFRYQKAADEWNARLIAGDDTTLPGNALEERRERAALALQVIAGGANPELVFSGLADDELEYLAQHQLAWVEGKASRPIGEWDEATGDYVEPVHIEATKQAFTKERAHRILASRRELTP